MKDSNDAKLEACGDISATISDDEGLNRQRYFLVWFLVEGAGPFRR